jgi:anti-sigma B factor antagonist
MAGLSGGTTKATVETESEGPGTTVVHIGGELDIASVPEVETEIEPIVAAAPECFVFELSKVTFMDSSGIAMLLRVAERVRRVEVREASAPVQLVIAATGLSDFLQVDV